MKKIIGIIISMAVICSSAVNVFAFSDISNHWARESIEALTSAGVVNGVSQDRFAPDETVTRAQYLKMIMTATGINTVTPRIGECLELDGYEWYAPYLQKALDAGLIPDEMIASCKKNVVYDVDENGNAVSSKVVYTGAFNGGLPITREEMAVFTQYCYQYSRTILTNKETNLSKIKDFADKQSISSWALVSVRQAVANGFITGMENNLFMPAENATRAQAATIIYRVINSMY